MVRMVSMGFEAITVPGAQHSALFGGLPLGAASLKWRGNGMVDHSYWLMYICGEIHLQQASRPEPMNGTVVRFPIMRKQGITPAFQPCKP